jgi:hypothetical protein
LRQAYLALCNRPQRLNNAHFRFQTWRIINEAHHHLHHLGDRLLKLAMLLAQQLDLLIEQTPVAAVLAYRDDGD